MRKVLILDARDNIAVCLADLKAGDVIEQDDLKITVINPIPRGHKIASKAIAKDDGIIKYGERMGHAIAPLQPVNMYMFIIFSVIDFQRRSHESSNCRF